MLFTIIYSTLLSISIFLFISFPSLHCIHADTLTEQLGDVIEEAVDSIGIENYPYKKASTLGGISLGENMSLSIPSWILSLIFIVFLGVVGYIIKLIFDSEKLKELKATEKKVKRQAKNAKKGATSGSGSTPTATATTTTPTTSTGSKKRSSSRKAE